MQIKVTLGNHLGAHRPPFALRFTAKSPQRAPSEFQGFCRFRKLLQICFGGSACRAFKISKNYCSVPSRDEIY